MKEEHKRTITKAAKDASSKIAEVIKPILDIAKNIEEAINPKKEFLAIYRKNECCIGDKIAASYQYYTWSELVDLINREGKDNLMIFKIEDEVVIQNEISIIEEEGKE